MDYFIWDREESLLGLSAGTILNSRADFKYGTVIVIHKKGDRKNVVMMETLQGLRDLYEIDSTNPDVVGFVVAVILAQEQAQTIKEKLEQQDDENKDELLETYTGLLEDLNSKMNDMNIDVKKDEKTLLIPLALSYIDPECSILDLSDIDEDVEEKTITVVLDHVFISGEKAVDELKCAVNFKNELDKLLSDKYIQKKQNDEDALAITERKIEMLESEVSDESDALLRINVNKVYQYPNVVICDCENGQTLYIQREAINTIKNSSIAYEKRREGSNEKYKVHYKIMNINLNTFHNELLERGNSVFVIEI